MNNIITKNIGTLEFIELRDYMNMCIRNSILACDDDGEKISVFKDCTMDEYFCEYQDIYDDNDVKVGIGVDTISHKFVLNEETRADFENAFCQARDAAYEEAIEDAINDIEEETEIR